MVGDLIELTKPRIVAMVMVTAAAGAWLAGPSTAQAIVVFHLLVGTVLVAAGTNALNQVAERDVDALMRRTRNRPLPAGKLAVPVATTAAWTAGAVGVAYLAAFVNAITAALAALTLLSYVFVYTPLKRRSSVATLVGAVPGALPIVGGWAAIAGGLHAEAWILFWILFLWQLPHFLALAWLYRDDYRRAKLRMLSVDDDDGRTTFLYASLYAGALIPVALSASVVGLAGGRYFLGALVLSTGFLAAAIAAARRRTPGAARRLFRVSLAYLPLLLILMAVDRIP